MTETQEERLRRLLGFDECWDISKELTEVSLLSEESSGCHISKLLTVDEGWNLHYKNVTTNLTEDDIEVLCKYLEQGISKKYIDVATKTGEMFIAMCEKEDVIGSGELDA